MRTDSLHISTQGDKHCKQDSEDHRPAPVNDRWCNAGWNGLSHHRSLRGTGHVGRRVLGDRGIPDGHRRDEPVSPAGDGLDEVRVLRVVSQHLPDLADRVVNAVIRVEKNALAPDSLDNLIPRD